MGGAGSGDGVGYISHSGALVNERNLELLRCAIAHDSSGMTVGLAPRMAERAKFPLAERTEHGYTAEIALLASFP
jgi:hypothetical protein